MCGIVAAVSKRNIVPVLLEGLRQLEYRGYDSAGLAVIDGTLRRLRSIGRVAQLARVVQERGLAGNIGIAHTRWATHGVPSERNAHPHVSGGLAVVHNGIIENHEQIRRRLAAQGYCFESDTDTEVIAHLIHSNRSTAADLIDAVRRSIRDLVGAYAIAVIDLSSPDRLVAARAGAPLVLGLGEDENFAASDTAALLQVTRRVVMLEEGDCAQVGAHSVLIVDANGHRVERVQHVSRLDASAIERGSYRHFMYKEIFEQPGAILDTLAVVSDVNHFAPHIFGDKAAQCFSQINAVLVLACGTSYHAGMVARYWLEKLAGLSCTVEIASEYRYRESVPQCNALVIAISQSGETADTLAALRHARSLGHRHCMSICNAPESALARDTELGFMTRAGPEIGVASTKAFTAQLASLLVLAITLARHRHRLSDPREMQFLQLLRELPAAVAAALGSEARIKSWAQRLAQHEHALFLGRGIHFPIAMEGALKLKETSY
ncbi:MAG TPA: glutamine--fructose-6-phosphate transaminase (isomerizing), partial [Burkholderiales bacterium]